MISIFNRSYYEEVLVVRVHPEFLETQWLQPNLRGKDLSQVWRTRYQEINAFEEVLTSKYVRILKFFLNVSKKEQKERFLKRLDDPEKNWKFSANDVRERKYWDAVSTGLRRHAERHQHRSRRPGTSFRPTRSGLRGPAWPTSSPAKFKNST